MARIFLVSIPGNGIQALTMRCSLLDIQSASYRCPAQPATVVRMQIQPRNFLLRHQRGSQLQLCVPQVVTDGDSYRMRQARARKGTTLNKT
jgi:hypothetical protein